MNRALVSSRSFGAVSKAGERLLEQEGFEVRHIGPEERPLDEEKMARIMQREQPTVIICGAEPVTRKVLEASSRLSMVMKHGVGVDNIDIEAATRLGIPVANAPGTNTEAVADLAVALMLTLLRGIVHAVNSTRNGGWERYVGHELGALTVGVIGTGRIGRSVIGRVLGFGCLVLAHDVVRIPEIESHTRCRYVDLEYLLAHSDIVTLHVPLMDRTRKMIGRRELGLMKQSAFLVNVARGELVDEDVLHEHLRSRKIAGAALDVYSVEPPQASPLIKLDNVLPSPHIAAYTYESMERMDRACGEIIIQTLRGTATTNVLNPEAWTQGGRA
jgi:D-3-phosphoglycerate dehydrogenase